ncbi:MAG: helix-turn-helix transcriptional regulator [Solirubrobacterales bacterium]|nr:helix-turn-helix transcriptional regulator [Solirubrobacterales bacterium]
MSNPNRIQELREAAGISRVELAARLGVTDRTVARWERGDVQIPDEQKLALADVFETTVTHVMGWDESNGNGVEAAAP